MRKFQNKKIGSGLKKGIMWASTAMVLGSSLVPLPVMAAVNKSVIEIEKPGGWEQEKKSLHVTVETSAMGEGFSIAKVEAKIGSSEWKDITSGMQVEVEENCTVYIRVTDAEGNTYEQNRSVSCYDAEKPTLAASLTNGVLSIQAYDTISGVASVTVNGTKYTDLAEGSLKIQLTQKNLTTKQIELTATDNAGNESGKYTMQNPYYEWAVKQQEQSKSEETGTGSLSTTTDVGTTASSDASGGTQAPLPQSATATAPTDATGTVTEQTVTQAAEQTTGETVDNMTQTGSEGSKVFYTITTKSGKTFYLIVDNSKSDNNVYLLTEVSEQDLMNFTLSDTVTLPDEDTVYAALDDSEKEEETELKPDAESEKAEESEKVMPEEKNPFGTYILIGIAAIALFGAGFYFKVYKPKHEFDDEDEYEEYEEEDTKEPVENEDEEAESKESQEEEELLEEDEIPEEDAYEEDDAYEEEEE